MEAQPQETGLDRPVFVTVLIDSPLVRKKGALRVTGVSTEMIPNMNSAGRYEPIDRSGLVGPQYKTEQPVLLGLDAGQMGNGPAGLVGPNMNPAGRRKPVDRSGPVGTQNKTEQSVLLGLKTDERGTRCGRDGKRSRRPSGP